MTSRCSSAAPIDDRPDRDPAHHHHDGKDVEEVRQPVARVRERDHWFASESRYRPSMVNATMTASIQYCESVAFLTSR